MNQSDRGKVAARCGFAELIPDCHSPVPEGLARLAQARTVHGGYGAEMRTFRELVRELREDARRLKAERS